MNDHATRRDVLVSGGLGLLVTAGCIPTAQAKHAELDDSEKANIKLVKELMASWNTKPLDIEKIVNTYFAPNATVRWAEDQPPAVGTTAAIAAAKALMPPDFQVEIRVDDIFARGPLVATSRVDVIKVPGQADQAFNVAGVHIVKDGKLVEYTDYLVK